MCAAFKLAGITEQLQDVHWLRNMPASELPEPESVVCHTLQVRAMTPTACGAHVTVVSRIATDIARSDSTQPCCNAK